MLNAQLISNFNYIKYLYSKQNMGETKPKLRIKEKERERIN